MKRYDYIVGIDPDSDKSGVATIRTSDRLIEVSVKPFPNLMQYFRYLRDVITNHNSSVLIVVEAGWLNESNWHLGKYDSKALAAAKGKAVGRNHETGRKIAEMARDYYGLEVEEVRPLKKCWKGPEGKITHEEISFFIPGLPKRTNQEMRDAALISWNRAGIPIRVLIKTPSAKRLKV